MRHSRRLDLAGIDFEAFRTAPLDDDSLRCIEYMHDVEHHTACYLRDLLVTSAHADPEITSFLVVLGLRGAVARRGARCGARRPRPPGGRRAGAGGPASPRHPRQAQPARRRRRLGTHSGVTSSPCTPRGVRSTSGPTQAGYVRLAARSGHPCSASCCAGSPSRRVGHIDFYASQAVSRLDGRPRVQAGVRWALGKLWRPVGFASECRVHPRGGARHSGALQTLR